MCFLFILNFLCNKASSEKLLLFITIGNDMRRPVNDIPYSGKHFITNKHLHDKPKDCATNYVINFSGDLIFNLNLVNTPD